MVSSSIDSLSQEQRVFPPPASIQGRAWIRNIETYRQMHERSLKDPEGFWSEAAQSFVWSKKWDRVLSYDWKDKIELKWFEGAKTNITVNGLDRHLEKNRDRTAYIWVGNTLGEEKKITYGELHREVCRFANGLKSVGVRKGDRVAIYLPMIPELVVAMLGCARIGAIHSIIFGGFSAESIKDRILDAGCRFLITSDGGYRGPKKIPIKETADQALALAEKAGHTITKSIVVRRTGEAVTMTPNRDIWWDALVRNLRVRVTIQEFLQTHNISTRGTHAHVLSEDCSA